MKKRKYRRCEYETFLRWAWDMEPESEPSTGHRTPVDTPDLKVGDKPKTRAGDDYRPFD